MGNLKPGKSIIYERDDKGKVWGRYHGETERWQVGVPADCNNFLDYAEWRDMWELSKHNSTLHSLIEKTINTYRLIKQ